MNSAPETSIHSTAADLVEAAKQADDESARATLAALNLRFMRAVEEPLMQRI